MHNWSEYILWVNLHWASCVIVSLASKMSQPSRAPRFSCFSLCPFSVRDRWNFSRWLSLSFDFGTSIAAVRYLYTNSSNSDINKTNIAMGRLMRFRRGTPYRKFGSESSLLVPEQPNNKEQVYNCSQCGHEGTIKSVSTYCHNYTNWVSKRI